MAAALFMASLLPLGWSGGRGEDAAFVVQNEMKITQWKKERRGGGYKPNFSGMILMQCKVIYIFWAPIKLVC